MKKGTKMYRGTDRMGRHIWRIRVWDGTKQISETFKAPPGVNLGVRAADGALAALVRRTGSNGPNDPLTLEKLSERWLDGLEGRLSPTTLRDYRSKMKVIVGALGPSRLDAVSSLDLDNFYEAQQQRVSTQSGEPLSPRTVLKYHRIISSMFRQAERWDLISQSPARNARAPRAQRSITFTPSVSLVKDLVEACTSDKMRLAILLAASLGARRGELCGLRWEDVDEEAGVISINRSVYEKRGGGVGIKDTKTDRPRKISVDVQALAALSRIKGEGFIFSNDGETPWHPDHMTEQYREVRDKVTTVKVRFHDLRHFHATQLIAAGFDAVTVSKRLGHANVTTTLDTYSSALDERDRAASNAIGELLTGSG